MHPTSRENMEKCFQRHIHPTRLAETGGIILDLGGSDVNGSYRSVFPSSFRYMAADIDAGPGVDVVLADPYVIPLEDASIDIVVSGQAFEHIEFFWRTFSEMVRVLKPDGFIFLIAPSAGEIHRFPVDCYRFYPDAYAALAKSVNCDLIEVWRDERGPWQDLVGVFRHKQARALQLREIIQAPLSYPGWSGEAGTPEEERLQGAQHYREVLARMHATLTPANYMEIGIRQGESLALAQCPAIGVDPYPDVQRPLPANTQIVKQASDAYFASPPADLAIDLAFIDGLHHFEQVLRDFMHVERHARPGAVAIIDDIFPNHPRQADRKRSTRAWTGDVWKLHQVLQTYRPDLALIPLDTYPTGLLLVAGLNPANRVLWDQYNPIVRGYLADTPPPSAVLARVGALAPNGGDFTHILDTLIYCRTHGVAPAQTAGHVRAALQNGPPRPALSVIIVCYNMSRELPRTVRSFSAAMQRGIAASDYELIIVDNGSTQPFDEAAIRALGENISVHHVKDPTVSPVAAINLGLAVARGELVGVCIDGARMASPGLLASALAASKLHSRPVIGSLAFHLGHEVQMKSVLTGYNQAVEDVLLAGSEWEEDGYRLFGVSVFAGSSADGWFAVPAETNALFLTADHWREIGGFDPGFKTPGGGLANLDTWRRVCDDPTGELIILLGEATFHQVHGGIATNSPVSKWDLFHDEYVRLRGKPFEKSSRRPLFFGTFEPHAYDSLLPSVLKLRSDRI